jgi:putative membrane protein
MMGYGYGGGVWMWVFGGLIIVGVLLLAGLLVWAVVTATTRGAGARTTPGISPTDGRERTRQVLDERYASGEMTSEEYTERLHLVVLKLSRSREFSPVSTGI